MKFSLIGNNSNSKLLISVGDSIKVQKIATKLMYKNTNILAHSNNAEGV